MSQEKTSIGAVRACPQCKEEIQLGAKKCKHCGADMRNWFMRHPVISTILVFFVLLKLAQYNNANFLKTNAFNDTSVTEMKNQVPKEWVRIFTLKGNGNQNSESFATTGGNLKLVAKTSSDGRSITYSAISIESDSGKYLSGADLSIMTEVGKNGAGNTIVRNATAGSYYVSVISGVDWEVTVYEER